VQERLVPEMVMTARLSLCHPLTFEALGDELRLFEGWILRDLADVRLRSIRKFSLRMGQLSECLTGPSKIWVNCPTARSGDDASVPFLPSRLEHLRVELLIQVNKFSHINPNAAQLCDKYLRVLEGRFATSVEYPHAAGHARRPGGNIWASLCCHQV